MIDLSKYSIVLDVWEGSLDIDETILREADVDGLIIRMNDTRGGQHIDQNFLKQWEQAKGFGRAAYFVAACWMTASSQIKFILDNLPKDCKTVFLDVELHYDETPVQWGNLLVQLISALLNAGIRVGIYSGKWFEAFVFPWPKGVPYWLAAYPKILYPDNAIQISWDELKRRLATLDWTSLTLGDRTVLWQNSGDRLILPGTANRTVDINLIAKTDFELIFGKQEEQYQIFIPIVMNNYKYQLTSPYRYSRVIPQDSAKLAKFYPFGSKFTVVEKWGDWGKLDSGAWIRINTGVKAI